MAKPNWKDKTIWTGDNLPIMRRMNSETVDLVYLDPPFNSNANYAAPIGSKAAGAHFKDTWSLNDVDIAWLDLIEAKHPALNRAIHAAMNGSDKFYLIYMAIRLLEVKRVLKQTGSVYLHCDPTMGHYIKVMMDAIFGRKHFRNEIVWGYTGPGAPGMRQFNRKHDTIFWYSVGAKWTFNADAVRVPHADGGPHVGGWGIDKQVSSEYGKKGKIPETWWVQAPGNGLAIAARQKQEYKNYPTQKPLALLRRIIQASSSPGDIVFDPFCGCATTCVAADELQRNWMGIDISPKAVELTVERIRDQQGMFKDIIARKDLPQRTDLGKIPKYNAPENRKYLYGEQGGHCNGCGEHFQPQHLVVDHIIAKSQGGTDAVDNLQLLCNHCNSVKGDRGQEYLISRVAGQKIKYI